MKAAPLFIFIVVIILALKTSASKFTLSQLLKENKAGTLRAGVSKLDATLPIGTPLAGYNHGDRRVKYWPIPSRTRYTYWMMPSQGILDISWAKALVIDNGIEKVCFVSVDAIGADGGLIEAAYHKAVARGFAIKRDNVIISASHTHSGPGGVSRERIWEIAPATDLFNQELLDMYSDYVSTAMVTAENTLQPVKIALGQDLLKTVTENRRAGESPYLKKTDIDPYLSIIKIDTLEGVPLATVWNFAIHGTCYGTSNMKFSSDVMGGASRYIEQMVGGVALFVNADAGDIAPTGQACSGKPDFAGGLTIAQTVKQIRDSLTTTTDVEIQAFSQHVDFGKTNMNLTFARVANCSKGGPLDICGICKFLNCDLNLHLGSEWVENRPRFTAIRFTLNGKSNVIVTMPGEALHDLGIEIRSDTTKLGFDKTFLFGYSNNHMGYFATPREYDVGGYESELTFWGEQTAEKVRNGCLTVARKVVKTT